MGQDAGHVAAREVREAVLVVRVGEGVALGLQVEEALMGVHARAVDAVDGLGHEGRVEAVQVGDGLERELEGDRVVGRAQAVVVLEVDLVLAGGHLVVRGLDPDAEGLERVDHVLADFLGEVGREVEVAGLIVRQRRDLAVVVAAEEEELELGPGVPLVAQLGGALELALEDEAGVARERVAGRGHHVADDAGRAAAAERAGTERAMTRLPGDLREGVHVRAQPLVALGDPGEALDRAAVEPGAVLDGALELVERDGDRLHDAQDVRELELHEADVVLLGRLDLGDGIHLAELDRQRQTSPARGSEQPTCSVSTHECRHDTTTGATIDGVSLIGPRSILGRFARALTASASANRMSGSSRRQPPAASMRPIR